MALGTPVVRLIDRLVHALQSVATDRLIGRGEDQLFSLKGVLAETNSQPISGANGHIESPAVPEGEYWLVTNVVGNDATTATTAMRMMTHHDAVDYRFGIITKAIAADEETSWSGLVPLNYQDTIRVYFQGGLAGDTCAVWVTGYRMTVEV